MTARQTPPRGTGSPAPAAGDGQGGAAGKKNKTPKPNDGKALNHFLTATGMISAGNRASAVIELHKGIRIAGPNLREDLERLLSQVERVLDKEATQ